MLHFSSFGDAGTYTGWIVSFDSSTLEMKSSWASTIDNGQASIWQGGNGPAIDTNGNIYFMTGNGDYDALDSDDHDYRNYGDSVVELDSDLTVLPVASFTPSNQSWLNANDVDLGSGGVLLVENPQQGNPLCIGGGKQSILYVLDCGNNLNLINQVQVGPPPPGSGPGDGCEILGSPVLYTSTDETTGNAGKEYVYIWTAKYYPRRFQIVYQPTAKLKNPVQNTTVTQLSHHLGGHADQGGFLSISCDGQTDSSAILWANHASDPIDAAGIDSSQLRVPGNLFAFNATSPDLELLWSSTWNPIRDDYGNYNKFAVPTVGFGRVYQGTKGGIQWNQTLDDQCTGSPAIISMNDSQLAIIFASTRDPQTLCLRISPDGRTWPDNTRYEIPYQQTLHSPGVAFDDVNSSAYIGWIATDGSKRICLMQCDNDSTLQNWYGPGSPTNEKSDHGVAMAFGAGNLFVAWTELTVT
jgi:hypothetical protein